MSIRTRTSGIMVAVNVEPTAAAGYEGPGDINPGAFAFWGVRGYTAASVGTNAIRIQFGDATLIDYDIQADGFLDTTTIAADLVTHGAPMYVSILYDQIGTNHVQSFGPDSTRPTLEFNVLGGQPGIRFTEADSEYLLNGAMTGPGNQPYIFSVVANAISDPSNAAAFWYDQSNIVIVQPLTGDIWSEYAGNSGSVTAAHNTAHAGQFYINGAASSIMIDGATTGGLNAGATNIAANPSVIFGRDPFNQYLNGYLFEIGLWQGGPAGTFDMTAANNNQHGTSGYNF